MANHKVSFIIPSWNRISDLKRLIESIFSQDCEDYEIIAVDNGSTDGTREYLESTDIESDYTFVDIPYRNHTDSWVLRDIPERKLLREWLRKHTSPPRD